MFKTKKLPNPNFEKLYCKGFNVGIEISKKISPEFRAQTKELLYLLITSKPKDITFQAILNGYSYQIEQEQYLKRMAQIKKITAHEKSQENDIER
jgi:hypothetical protein